jgi:hypothetical protein
MKRQRQPNPPRGADALSTELRQLIERIAALQEQARAAGVFLNDRELLVCPHCGLLEDISFAGQLFTCRPTALGQDAGLRFEEVSANRFRCPACGTVIDVGHKSDQ